MKSKNKKGFTLVELIATIAIIGIIILIAIPNVMKSFNNSRIQAMVIQENKLIETGDILLADYCHDAINQSYKEKCDMYYQELVLSEQEKIDNEDIVSSDKTYKYICVEDMKKLNYYTEELVFSGTPCKAAVIYEIDNHSKMQTDSYAYVKCGDAYSTENRDVRLEELFKNCFDEGDTENTHNKKYTITVKHVENDLGGMEIKPREKIVLSSSEIDDVENEVKFTIETINHVRNGNTYYAALNTGGLDIDSEPRTEGNIKVYDITKLPKRNLTITIVYTVEKHKIITKYFKYSPNSIEKIHNYEQVGTKTPTENIGFTYETVEIDAPLELTENIDGKDEKYNLTYSYIDDMPKPMPINPNIDIGMKDKVVELVYQRDEFNILYENKGGSGCTTGRVKYDKPYGELCKPTKKGYTFKYWSLTDGGSQINSTDTNSNYHDIKLYAVWQANTYTITYHIGKANSTGGVNVIATKECTFDKTCTLDSFASFNESKNVVFPYSKQYENIDPDNRSNYGWSFAGWTNYPETMEIKYADKLSFVYNKDYDLDLYAMGKRNLHINGGLSPTKSLYEIPQLWNPYSTKDDYLTEVTLPEGKTISGWNFIGYRPGSDLVTGEVIFDQDDIGTPFKAKYNVWPYIRSVYGRFLNIKYNANGGTGTTATQTEKQYYNSGFGDGTQNKGDNFSKPTFTLATNGFVNTGYNFSKWTEGSTSGTEYSEGSSYQFAPEPQESNEKTFYAKWSEKTFTITYYLAKGDGTTNLTKLGTSTCKYNQDDCKLTAFDSFDVAFPYSYQDEQKNDTNNYGWSFYGWVTSKDAAVNTSKNTFDIAYTNSKVFTYTKNGNLNLYAIGKRNMHFNGGVAPVKASADPVQYWNPYGITDTYLTKVSIPSKTNIDSWTFIGYKCGSNVADSSVTLDSGLAGTEYVIPYNTWPYTRSVYKRTLTLEYKPNTGSGSMSNQTNTQYYNSGYGKDNANNGANITSHSFTLAYNSFTKDGYEFVEWKEDSTSGTSRAAGSNFTFSPGVNADSKKTFYATWKQNDNILNSYKCANKTVGSEPYIMVYTGNCKVIDDGNGKWRIKYLTSGQLKFTRGFQFDVFLVGGGGSGANYGSHSGGGGGGYTTAVNGKSITANTTYQIKIGSGGTGGDTNGSAGTATTAFGLSAAGGSGGGGGGYMIGSLKGGNGGSGGGAGSAAGHAEIFASTPGRGGTDGSAGKGSFTGTGQGTTTREFAETTGALYAKGGDGANSGGTIAAGGANTGNGGAGGGYNGGSGVVVIRQSNTNPYFTYTGNYEIVDNNGNQINTLTGEWKVRFLTSGKLKFTNFGSATNGFDVFLVGGGGGGTSYDSHSGGGGGGYTTTKKQVSLNLNTEYNIVVGNGGSGGGTTAGSGGTSSAFGLSAAGGSGGGGGGYMIGSLKGGDGGSGGGAGSATAHAEMSASTPGLGGTNGNGGRGTFPGTGQGKTTREFEEATGALYAEGGDGHSSGGNMRNGAPNTGNGGAGGSYSGGSGIVIIRPSKVNSYFSYTGTYEITDDNGNPITSLSGNWKIRLLSSGTLTFNNLGNASNGIDVFLVGGGGGSSSYGNHNGGGGGGYTKTKKNVSVQKSTKYEIIIGNGGSSGSTSGGNGGSTSAFGLSASGGQGGGNGGYMVGSLKGGDGGSGGGAGSAAGHAEQSASTPGLGGTNGNAGKGTFPGTGQGTTTREFGETSGTLYSKGGDGSTVSGGSFTNGGLNTGNGGAGGGYSGGSGIVIIRNKR